jgi:type VI protein secretion system component Hcp
MKSTKNSQKVKVKDLKATQAKGVKGGFSFTKTVDKSSPTLN